jgi:hypothetical protein
MEEIEKTTQMTAEKIESLLTTKLNKLLMEYPSLFTPDKTILKKFLAICDTKKFNENSLIQFEIFKTFSRLCMEHQDFMYGYKIALKTKDFTLINSSSEGLSSDFLPTEKEFFFARTCFELLYRREICLAKDFIKSKLDHGNQLQGNNPILNYAFLLTFLLENFEKKGKANFTHFETLLQKYSNCLETEPVLKKYLNAISKVYFNTEIIKEEEQGKNGLENIMKMFG